MAHHMSLAAAQLGPIARTETRREVVARMKALLSQAKSRGCEIVVFPELALTSFFPRWVIEDEAELDSFYETDMPSSSTAALFEHARDLGLAFSFGYAELVKVAGAKGAPTKRFNTSIIVDQNGDVTAKYRKVHLPGTRYPDTLHPFHHLEKRYFEVGDLGWPIADLFGVKTSLCICNDRRWPETWRCMGLQGAQLAFVGYNTPRHDPVAPEQDRLADFHNHLVMQAAAYQNCLWIVAAAKAGVEEGSELIAGSAIIAPSGELIARAASDEDELVVANCDMDLGKAYRRGIFDFESHRQPSKYQIICAP